MQYLKDYSGHFYAWDGDDTCLHIFIDNSLLNILTGEEFKIVQNNYTLYEITESDFMTIFKAIDNSYTQFLFQ